MRKGLRLALITLGVLVVIGIAARLAAPTLVERYVNRSLADMGEYRGTVSGVDLHLLSGGYVLRDLTIVKIDSKSETPFAAMPTMDLTLQWHALFRGQAVGEVVMHTLGEPDPVCHLPAPTRSRRRAGRADGVCGPRLGRCNQCSLCLDLERRSSGAPMVDVLMGHQPAAHWDCGPHAIGIWWNLAPTLDPGRRPARYVGGGCGRADA